MPSSTPPTAILVLSPQGHPLAATWEGHSATPRAPVVILRSNAEPGQTPWLPAARAAWDHRAAELETAVLAAGSRPAILPGSDDVISDIPSTLTFLRARPAWGLVLAPDLLLTPAMRSQRPDHLARIEAALLTHPALLGLIASTPQPDWLDAWAALRPDVWVWRGGPSQSYTAPT